LHNEYEIPVKIIKTGGNENRIWIVDNPGFPIPMGFRLFYIEVGDDGSVYTGLSAPSDSIELNDGSTTKDIPMNKYARKHEYISFHASSAINYPGREGNNFLKFPFSIDENLNKTVQLCTHYIGKIGMQMPSAINSNDLAFEVFESYGEKDLYPIFHIDITAYKNDFDKERILQEAGKDNLVSYGLLTEEFAVMDNHREKMRLFLRVKLDFQKLDSPPDGHIIRHATIN
jgi:hypothetical protein